MRQVPVPGRVAAASLLAVITLAGCAAATPTPSAGPGQLVINSCGGKYGDAIQAAYVVPFEAATGIDVVYDANCDDQTTKLGVQSEVGQVQWDVIGGFGGPLYRQLHDDGLLMTIDPTTLNVDTGTLIEGALQPFGVGFHFDAIVLGYRSSQFPGTTPTVADYFDVASLPGRRAITGGGFEDWTRPALALVADGIEPAALIPLDWDRAYAVLDRIKPSAVFYHGGTEMVSVMVDGQADMCLCSDARMLQAQTENDDIRVAHEGGLRTLIYWAIPADAPNPQAALEFLRFTLNAQRQAAFTEQIGYSGVVLSSFDLLPAELQGQVLANPDNMSSTWSFTAEQDAWLADHATEASDRYAQWVGE